MVWYRTSRVNLSFFPLRSRNLLPAQQEALYELKASRMGAMRSQNQALKRELQLNQKKQHLLEARYAKTQSYSGSETLRAAHALEAKLRGGERIIVKKKEKKSKKKDNDISDEDDDNDNCNDDNDSSNGMERCSFSFFSSFFSFFF